MITLEQLVQDKSVALVGSAQSLLSEDCAQQIDAHDVVIRMNLSIPHPGNEAKVGKKTDVWCMGRPFIHAKTPAGTQHILFMKLTEAGDRDWPIVQKRPVPATRWPSNYEDIVHEFVGSPPGTGIRLLYWLKRIAKPSTVNVFGMDCWKTPSSWSGAPAPAHNPDLEAAAMATLTQ